MSRRKANDEERTKLCGKFAEALAAGIETLDQAAVVIHGNSTRRDKPLVTVNGATIQESLLESELFGHERRAFTGAYKTKP